MALLIPKRRGVFLIFSIFLIIAFLFIQIITLKIGVGGYLVYGPDVENVNIYGGWITGKDTNWWGINFAYKFQFSVILCVLLFSIISLLKPISRALSITNLCLVSLFPIWLFMYLGGIQNNSDGADLSIHINIGVFVYLLILILQIIIVRNNFKRIRNVPVLE